MRVHCSKFIRSHGAQGEKQTSLSACRQGLTRKNHVHVHSRGRGGSQLLWPQTLAPPRGEPPPPQHGSSIPLEWEVRETEEEALRDGKRRRQSSIKREANPFL